jgi:hypothetical protein
MSLSLLEPYVAVGALSQGVPQMPYEFPSAIDY